MQRLRGGLVEDSRAWRHGLRGRLSGVSEAVRAWPRGRLSRVGEGVAQSAVLLLLQFCRTRLSGHWLVARGQTDGVR
ncbi:hypothetical protein GUJ93_ZPchr0002g23421 [Zizania palustris]|uniref:Uncharacterized protein n=1 Tax=Zizania palustris TaxID=103762 RepID=A0A8J5S3R6_ZIZPA|nr:hypothetical protein GUJ93_ZPchr0002g23421 [Zizania palustris]